MLFIQYAVVYVVDFLTWLVITILKIDGARLLLRRQCAVSAAVRYIQSPVNLRVVCVIISYCYFLRTVQVKQQILTRRHLEPVFALIINLSPLGAGPTLIRVSSCSPHDFKLVFLVFLDLFFIVEEFNYILGILLFSKRELTHFIDSFERHFQLLLRSMEYLLSGFSP